MVNPQRITSLNSSGIKSGPVVYWMSRDQRVDDNWALLYASEVSLRINQPLVVLFCLVPSYLNAQTRQYDFMLEGLLQVRNQLTALNIPFLLRRGAPGEIVPEFADHIHAGAVITDFNPLRLNRSWKQQVADKLEVSFTEVDAHNIVPCRAASPKMEYGAYTIRPKISRLLPEFLDPFPPIQPNKISFNFPAEDFPDFTASGFASSPSGTANAEKKLEAFLSNGLDPYAEARNIPGENGQSGLSPYLHFGQIAAQRVAMEVIQHAQDSPSKTAFLEELIVRRELSDNFCFYNPQYDSFDGFPNWARKSLDEHRNDPRPFLYPPAAFENADTHDDLWNAAQKEMLTTGKMHGYMRMYWAKKILEWSEDPEEALKTAIYLNDTYSLDGRDPNGYAGIAWAIGGTHDRAWFEREIFGKIRYMSYNGCKSKFPIKKYIMQNQG